jgi:hypothetical protein
MKAGLSKATPWQPSLPEICRLCGCECCGGLIQVIPEKETESMMGMQVAAPQLFTISASTIMCQGIICFARSTVF